MSQDVEALIVGILESVEFNSKEDAHEVFVIALTAAFRFARCHELVDPDEWHAAAFDSAYSGPIYKAWEESGK